MGYGNPPQGTQFKKGQSGNPKGRPKGNKPNPRSSSSLLDLNAFPKLLKAEMERMLVVKENGQAIKITVLEAAVRSMGVSAVKGSRLAQRDLINLVRTTEKEKNEILRAEMAIVSDYMAHCAVQTEMAKEAGLPEPEFIPHPDDVIINPETGEMGVNGPVTPEDKARWDSMLENRDNHAKDVQYCKAEIIKETEPEMRDAFLQHLIHAQKSFDIINDNVPKRYQTGLEYRSRKDGSSQPGDQKRKFWPGEN
ncbi:DUF5681 domain-containing protein [Parasphingorhabdus sp.]|uniref:DUF5681 domain-containing protein n=1 Tax=Parasphingorhabdus sp. TaxID=2709688 RepID=UPI003C744703